MDQMAIDRTEPAAGSKEVSARLTLTALALSTLLAALGVSIANVALPTLAQAFSAPFQHVQWIILAYLLAVTVCIVSVGRLGDVVGHRQVLLAGILLFTLASALCAAAPTLWMLVAARTAQGLGAAILMSLSIAFVGDTIPKERIGSAMGLLGTMSAIGTALGPSLGGVLIAGAGWRAIFLVMLPLGIANFILAYRYLPGESRKGLATRTGFDLPGTLLLAVTLAAYALAMTIGRGRFGGFSAGLIGLAVVAGMLFVLVEKRTKSPLVRLAILRSRVLSGSLAMNGLVSTVMMTTLVVGPFYLARGLGLSAALVGIVMSGGPIISALSGVPAGRMVDRRGTRAIILAGLSIMVAGSLALCLIPATFGIAGYITAIAILTPGYALFQAANNTATMKDVAADQRGVVSGMLSLSRNLGLITGASVMGAVFARASSALDIAAAPADAIIAGMHVTFAAAAVLALVALAVAMRTATIRPE
ncbi:MFS transporter [Phyllobacterium sp. BT25]|uniref:MFS transporter n=1 Tax=Phyllobacterium pellucidum TaxID=2740464 RepID=A0A849VJL2_9HYPH|nr:MFS transporter [Phyllobacterium pellucidum]NTS30395.1 MFS transporter [Phyllobacterium pellucidum]